VREYLYWLLPLALLPLAVALGSPPDDTEARFRRTLNEAGPFLLECASPFEMGGRGAMDGWLRVSSEAVEDDDDLARWVDRGLAYARSLPPK